MSDVRYQVFVSSTYADLKDERANVSQAIMEMNCFPAGMELFPASSIEQFDFIKTVIDESDYYVLIIGGRYGSLTEEGISFTEKEFDYAIEKNIEICAFIHSEPESIASGKTDENSELRAKLEKFKTKVSSGRLVKYWTEPTELPGKVVVSLNAAIRRKPSTGWVRGDHQVSPEAINQLFELKSENRILKDRLTNLQTTAPEASNLIDELNKEIKLNFTAPPRSNNFFDSDNAPRKYNFSVTVGEVLTKIGMAMITEPATINYEKIIPSELEVEYDINNVHSSHRQFGRNYGLSEESMKNIELALIALDFIKPWSEQSEVYLLTSKGQKALLELLN